MPDPAGECQLSLAQKRSQKVRQPSTAGIGKAGAVHATVPIRSGLLLVTVGRFGVGVKINQDYCNTHARGGHQNFLGPRRVIAYRLGP